MAFATSNVQRGVEGNENTITGSWTGSAGDASGTLTLAGGRYISAKFENLDSDSPQEDPQTTVTESGGTITVTVHNHQDVTSGRFKINWK